MGFSDLCDLDAKALAEKIVARLQVLGLDVKQCIAQCYDGASVMSGQVSGVQQRVREIVGNGCLYPLPCTQVRKYINAIHVCSVHN